MPPTDTTTAQRLATILLEMPVQHWIISRRSAHSSWRTIAAELRSATDGQVDVSHETVRAWSGEVQS